MRYPKSIRRPRDTYSGPEDWFHVVFHAHPKLAAWPDGVDELIWASVLEQLDADRVELAAACLMPDHLHLLLRPRGQDVILFTNTWKSWTTRQAWAGGVHAALWQPGMWDRAIRHEADFDATVAYIVENPVKSGLTVAPEDWPWTWAYHWQS